MLRRPNVPKTLFWVFLSLTWAIVSVDGKQIDSSTDPFDQATRFFQMKDLSVQIVVLSSILIGISCGLIGSYVVTRKLSLFGDVLSHAVLPGIAIGFLWSGEKNNLSLLIGATIAGFSGIACLSFLQRFTKVRQDSSLAIVLSSFYAIGICLLTRIQKMGLPEQSGLDSYLFGHASSLSKEDLIGIVVCMVLIGLFITLNYKQLLVTGFDPEFSRSIQVPNDLLQFCLWALISFCVISSLQLVGVVLVSALLVIPAATASLVASRMSSYLFWAALFGAISGFGGVFFSFLGSHLPTGPIIVLFSTLLLFITLFFRPQRGIFHLWKNSRFEHRRIANENTLKAAFQILESRDFKKDEITCQEMMRKRGFGLAEVESCFENLSKIGMASIRFQNTGSAQLPPQRAITLSPKGWEYACRIVRNHRLWELYLTNEAQYAPDHVHEDAEKIEHVLGEETVRQIERLLKNPKKDPHGKLIPSVEDICRGTIHEKTF